MDNKNEQLNIITDVLPNSFKIIHNSPYIEWITFFMFIVPVIWKILQFILNKFNETNKQRLELMKNILDSSFTPDSMKNMIQNDLLKIYFQECTGLNTDLNQRKIEAFYNLYDKNNQRVALHHYKRVYKYMIFDDSSGNIIIKIKMKSPAEIFWHVIFIIGIICSIYTIYLLVLLFKLLPNTTTTNFLTSLITFFIFLITSMYMTVRPYWLYSSLKHVYRQTDTGISSPISWSNRPCAYYFLNKYTKFSISIRGFRFEFSIFKYLYLILFPILLTILIICLLMALINYLN